MPSQPGLPFPAAGACASPDEWERQLSQDLGRPVQVRFGRSRTVPVRVREGSDGRTLEVLLHRAFGEAPGPVCESLARWLQVGRRARKACVLLDTWIEDRMRQEPTAPARSPRLQVAGTVYALDRLAEQVVSTCFPENFNSQRPAPALTWGRRGRSRSRRSLRLGSYDPAGHLVRIHPVLDQERVPEWFVRFVLMHEYLHAALPPRRGPGGRWVYHGAEFRARERAHPDYERAVAWETKNLPALIRSARRGTRFRGR